MSAINKVTVYYPEDPKKMEELQTRYSKAIAKYLIETLSKDEIDELLRRNKEKLDS